jgi:hypothetical protein
MAKSAMSFGTNTRKSLRKTGFVSELVEVIMKITSMQNLPRVILHKKIILVKFKIDIIINTKLVCIDSKFFRISGTRRT